MFLPRSHQLRGLAAVDVTRLSWANLQRQVMSNLASGNTQPMSNISVLATPGMPLYATDAGFVDNDIQAIDIGGARTVIQPVFTVPKTTTGQWVPVPDGYEPAPVLSGIMYALGNPDRPGWTILLYPGPNDTVLRQDFEQKDGFLKDMLAFVAVAVGMYYAIGALAAASGGGGAGASAVASSTPISSVAPAAEWVSGYELPMGSDLLSMTGAGVTPTNWFNPSIKDALSALKTVTGAITAITGAAAGGSGTRTPVRTVAPTYRTGTAQQTMLVPMPMPTQATAQSDNSALWIAAAAVAAALLI